ncbi:MAG: cupin domain-containing protein [Acetobacteraceae bacterium]|nr:cupin domain-containing protein [Acetobacteraceae bacterium]
MKGWLKVLMISAIAFAPAAVRAQNMPPHGASAQAVFLKLQDLKWQKTNPELGSNSPEISILHESPQETELLLRNPKNFHVPRHWHSADETITIIRGTFVLKHDGSEDRVSLDAGSFAWLPAKMIHEAWTKPDEDALLFITADGAFDINWVEGPPKLTQ